MEEKNRMKTLIVSNFPDETTEEQIKDLFRDHRVEKVTLRPKKYAVITFEDEYAAEKAFKEWREVVWSRHWLRLKRGRW
jgi:RNA recognition motif-containing protein